jgi:hypothetical protein
MITASPGCYRSLSSATQRPTGRPAAHPLAAAPRRLRRPVPDLPSTCGGPDMYLAPMLAGGQIPGHLRITAEYWRGREPGPRTGFSGGGALLGAKSRDHSTGWQRRWGFMSAAGLEPFSDALTVADDLKVHRKE